MRYAIINQNGEYVTIVTSEKMAQAIASEIGGEVVEY